MHFHYESQTRFEFWQNDPTWQGDLSLKHENAEFCELGKTFHNLEEVRVHTLACQWQGFFSHLRQ